MNAADIAGYTYQADNYCPRCIVRQVTSDPRHETTPAAPFMGAEDLLNQLAAYELLDRDDERTFDSGDFPKVIFVDQVEEGETCGECGDELA